MPQTQLKLFDAPLSLPDGMRYRADLLTPVEERALVGFIETLPLKPFEFAGGFRGNRRVTSFGWRYDYQAQRAIEAEPIPDELLALRRKVARFAGSRRGCIPAGTGHRIRAGRRHWLAQGQGDVRRDRRRLAAAPNARSGCAASKARAGNACR